MTSTDAIFASVIEWQRQIHRQPEIGFDTIKTASLCADVLRQAGLEVRENVGQTGVVADLDVPGSSKRVAFRADMDALPMDEETDLPHKSEVAGAAHLCGHDAHTAMLLGAAAWLSNARDQLKHSIRFIFQPCEERLPGGAPGMIRDGCLDGVEAIYGVHVWPEIPTGEVGILSGPAMASPHDLAIDIRGVGGHAATPHKTTDPPLAAAQIVTLLQGVVSRQVDPLQSAVVTIAQIHTGSADNVIPNYAQLRGTIRIFDDEVRDRVLSSVERIARQVGEAFGNEVEVTIRSGYPVLVNDANACDWARAALQATHRIQPEEQVEPSLGGEDFAFYLKERPGAFLFLGNYDAAKEIVHYCHHPRFQVDDEAMRNGVNLWCDLATRLELPG